MNYNNLCFKCFTEKPRADMPCPKCGYVHTPTASNSNCLPPGTLLHGRYIVGVPLGVGGFGITYKSLDTQVGGICAVKEYMPANCALRIGGSKKVEVSEQNLEKYNKIMKRFVEEAELVKKFHHPNVITISDSFFENNTAYYVMEYCDGIDLRKYTNGFKTRLTYEQGLNLLGQIMNGLEYIHAKGILHRDIAPDNIYVTRNNTVKILDFGSARGEMDQLNRELSVIIKAGYAPLEQYGGRGKQGPYTDIYALGATFYHLFTGKAPLESTQRVAGDSMEPLSLLRPDLPNNMKYCIEKCLALTKADRIQNIAEMRSILGIKPAQQNKKQPPKPPVQPVQPVYPQNQPVQPVYPPNQPVQPVYPQNQPVQPVYPQNQPVQPVYPPNQPPAGPGNMPMPNRSHHPVSGFKPRAELSARFAAYMIDTGIWSALVAILMVAADAFRGGASQFAFFAIVDIVGITVINTVLELICGATVGKLCIGLRVKDENGTQAMPGQIFIRNLIKILGVFVVVFANDGDLLQDRATNAYIYEKE